MNEIVKVHNDLTNEKLGKMTARELDLFMTICSKIKNNSTEMHTIYFDELRKLGNYTQNSNKVMMKDLRSAERKLIASFILTFTDDDGAEVTKSLFNEFRAYPDGRLVVSVEERAGYILDNLTKDFTRFELEEFTSLESKYSKRLYKLLKQYRSTGVCIRSKEEFYKDMDVPSKYTNSNFNRLILQPALKECGKYLKDLKCTPQKCGRGGAIKSYTFTFCKELTSEQMKEKAKKSFKKNRFNEMEQTTYDFEQLELDLLSN